MDLAKISPSATSAALLKLLDPRSGVPLMDETSQEPVTLSLVSRDSDDFKRLEQRQTNALLRKQMRGRAIRADAAEIESNDLDLLAACTKGWFHVVENGKELEFSTPAARELYAKYPWIKEQAADFIADRANFLGNS